MSDAVRCHACKRPIERGKGWMGPGMWVLHWDCLPWSFRLAYWIRDNILVYLS